MNGQRTDSQKRREDILAARAVVAWAETAGLPATDEELETARAEQ